MPEASSSFVFSLVLSVLTFGALQMFKKQIAGVQPLPILGGFVCSWFFVFFLTALNNLRQILSGSSYQSGRFDVVLALVITAFVGGSIHPICITTGIAFSLVAVYYLQRIATKTYQSRT
ncbi:hypothetical protein CAOG_02417 [Capsaspora owczarzaki ATCC 30864]|nr:hypothetical protein CAOG_02417 [Capsaspora owczarzaki ATCC 30864]|eukprot:XP_004349167.2 hypothetical protein CAOG_02417 [Capsaspora owczarzaki ATCC 30864]